MNDTLLKLIEILVSHLFMLNIITSNPVFNRMDELFRIIWVIFLNFFGLNLVKIFNLKDVCQFI
jgi:SNF2 family DNA or RNA helicase